MLQTYLFDQTYPQYYPIEFTFYHIYIQVLSVSYLFISGELNRFKCYGFPFLPTIVEVNLLIFKIIYRV